MKNKIILQLIGWILFVITAVMFIYSGIKNEDIILVIASIIFFISCFFFIADLIISIKEK